MSFRAQVWLAVGFAILVTIVTVAAAVFSKGGRVALPDSTVTLLTASDWVRGESDSTVSIIEYGDFQCPACKQYEQIMKKLLEEYGDRVAFGFRNFPLYQIHPNAGIAARAAESAGLQGKYWDMYDTLYDKQTEWAVAKNERDALQLFTNYAQTMGLDLARFATDIDSAAVRDKINNDVATGGVGAVNHTPTFFLNGKQIPNPQNYEQFKSIIDTSLAPAQ